MDLEQTAIERLQMASDMSLRLYKQPLVITYSGGKDSDVLLHLAGKAGIPYEVLHSLTTADAPETVMAAQLCGRDSGTSVAERCSMRKFEFCAGATRHEGKEV
jgi:diphthamide synthase (EF-2-diphthine--ammonia ligase)|nr:MAG TPA: 3'-phosphoadenosine 5'-phosphosulfate sulfotransferase [Bacteriophage sp.]